MSKYIDRLNELKDEKIKLENENKKAGIDLDTFDAFYEEKKTSETNIRKLEKQERILLNPEKTVKKMEKTLLKKIIKKALMLAGCYAASSLIILMIFDLIFGGMFILPVILIVLGMSALASALYGVCSYKIEKNDEITPIENGKENGLLSEVERKLDREKNALINYELQLNEVNRSELCENILKNREKIEELEKEILELSSIIEKALNSLREKMILRVDQMATEELDKYIDDNKNTLTRVL